MTWRDGVRNVLMGSSYEEHPVVAATKVISRRVPVPLEAPEPAMAMEEAMISALRRDEFLSDAPVLSPQDPAVRAGRFREGAVPSVQVETRARPQLEAEAPVDPRPAPLLTSPDIERAERLAERQSYQGLAPVMRRSARER